MLNPVFSAYKLRILWNAAPTGQMHHLQCLLYEIADKSSHWDNVSVSRIDPDSIWLTSLYKGILHAILQSEFLI